MRGTFNSNINYGKLIGQSHSGITLLNKQLDVVYRSPSAERITGWKNADLDSINIMDMLHNAERLEMEMLLQNLIGVPGFSQMVCIRFRHKAGHYVWVESTFTNMLQEPGVNAIVGSFIDVTERKHYEELLQNTLTEYGQIFNSVSDVICVVGTDRRFKKVNPAMCHLLEYTATEILDLAIDDLLHPEDLEKSKQRMNELVQNETPSISFENRYLTRTGKIKWLAWTATFAAEKDRLFCVARDITDKRELEAVLDRSSALARIGAWEVDMISNAVYWSPITRDIHEVGPDFVPTMYSAINSCKDGHQRKILSQRFAEVITKGTLMDAELLIVTQNGREKWTRVIGEAEFVNGKCIRVYGSLQDIDERKRAEVSAQHVLEEKHLILESIRDAFFTIDKNWQITYWNNIAATVLGKSKQEVLGHNLWQVFPRGIHTQSFTRYYEAIRTGQPVHFNDHYAPLNSWYEVSAYPSADGLSVYFKDITERIKYVNAIEEQNRKLSEISWLQSHVVRAPLCRIMGLVSILRTTGITLGERDEILGYITTAANELDGVIHNITHLTSAVDRERPLEI